MTKATGKRSEELTRDFVAFGVGDDGKPRAARFIVSNTGLLAKAAEAMKLKITEVTTEPVKEVAKKLPSGRLYSNGKGFVPNVRRDLYIKLAGALGIDPGLPVAPGEGTPLVPSGLPRTREEIEPGHLVVAQETLEYGWWEAVVIERDGDMLTLQWRDYPKQPKVVRHRNAVALLHVSP
jgi:hypothetical protein